MFDVYEGDESECEYENEEDAFPDGYPDELIPLHAFM
jgi:hypothetical protein